MLTIQSLYEAKLLSYPRTDCTYSTDEEFDYLVDNLGSLSTVVGWWKVTTWRGPIGFLLFDVQNNENSSFKVVKFPEAKSISLDVFDEVSGSL